jgi:lipid II:glycine glycyltransferase (peptidoglycan interpeptide bridge formation enzyme)
LAATVKAKRGWHWHIPHGPIADNEQTSLAALSVITSYLQKHGKRKMVAIRISPLLLDNEANRTAFANLAFRKAPIHVHADLTWVLNIDKSELQLLDEMRKTTRHAIRKAAKSNVAIEIVTNTSTIDRFWPLYDETKTRHGFSPWPMQSLRAQWDSFVAQDNIFSIFATYEGKDVAAAICPMFGQTVFYHHGASTKLSGSVPAAQAVQWAAIQEAKRRGATRYNFWGIAPTSAKATAGKPEPTHPFAGITTFKKGFGGEAINYLHAQDLPLSLGYGKLWLVDSFRKIRRGF